MLQAVTGADAELHTFSLPGARRRSSSRDNFVADGDEHCVRLADVADEGSRLHYECVGEACWRYRLDVETVRPLEPDVGYPICVAGRSPCPGNLASDGFDLGRINQRLAAFQRVPRRRPRAPTARECKRARDMLGAIIRRLPADAADLRMRIGGLAPAAVRNELLAIIDRQPESFAARLLVVDVFIEVGLGSAVEELQALASDVHRPIASRGLAFEVLSLVEPTATAFVLGALSPSQRDLLLEEQFGNLLVAAQIEPDAALLVSRTLADQVALGDHEFLGFLEHCRELVGVPAPVIYRDALSSPDLTPIRARLLDILVRAGGSQTAALLQRTRDETADATWRRRLQHALIEVLTDSVAGHRRMPSASGRAWLGRKDASDRFVVFVHIEAARASCFAGLSGCFAGGFSDAELVPSASREDVRRRLAAFLSATGIRLVDVPLEQAAERVALVARRTRERGMKVSRQASPAVALIESGLRSVLPHAARARRF